MHLTASGNCLCAPRRRVDVGGYARCAESCRVRSLHPVRSRNTDLHGALKCELRTCVLAENDTPASSEALRFAMLAGAKPSRLAT